MNDFTLNERLANETHAVTENEHYYVRLNKNSLIPWIILIPKTSEIELFKCDNEFKNNIRNVVDWLAAFSQDYFTADKMNVATIGNVVSQLHIHIVARKTNDFAWPDPVWGKSDFVEYDQKKLHVIIGDIQSFLNDVADF
ncbi:MAG: HIT domain-containing protein [Gammaproteobacteria bacterium]|nr:HIT domain-containing protein [Gammaproteobacteria bacterium]